MKIAIVNNETLFDGETDQSMNFDFDLSGVYSFSIQISASDDTDWTLYASLNGDHYFQVSGARVSPDTSNVIPVFKPEYKLARVQVTPQNGMTQIKVREYTRKAF